MFGDERLPPRFWRKVHVKPATGCWEWLASSTHDGYPLFNLSQPKRRELAHRVAFKALAGPIPPALELDHVCRVRGCVNHRHLEAVTRRVNTLRGATLSARNLAKTHCSKGHEFTAANTYKWRGKRNCRACNRGYAASAALKRKAAGLDAALAGGE